MTLPGAIVGLLLVLLAAYLGYAWDELIGARLTAIRDARRAAAVAAVDELPQTSPPVADPARIGQLEHDLADPALPLPMPIPWDIHPTDACPVCAAERARAELCPDCQWVQVGDDPPRRVLTCDGCNFTLMLRGR